MNVASLLLALLCGFIIVILHTAMLSPAAVINLAGVELKVLPADLHMRNVKTEYGAKGDGITNDTAAIQRALTEGRMAGADYYGLPQSIYFPAGTYLVDNTLEWIGCCVSLQGQGKGTSIIKLRDNAAGYDNPNGPKAVLKSPAGNMSFHQHIADLTVNTGTNNPGAIAIDYIANNSGSLRDVVIKSDDGKGKVGLDMSRQWPGPSLIKDVEISGFDYGIHTKHAEYGPTFEHITLLNQQVAGIYNEGNTLAIRGLESTNTVPVIQNQEPWGVVIVLDGSFQGGSSTVSAIDNNGYLYARNVVASGYQSVIRTQGAIIPGTSVTEYVFDKIYSLFDSPQISLNLPIQETPTFSDTELGNWEQFTPRWYGDTDSLQSLLNSGKSTIYFPHGVYFAHDKKVVKVPATVRRIVGFSSIVNRGPDRGGIILQVEENSDQPLIIEQFQDGISVEHASARTVVLKHGHYGYRDLPGAGELFLEDVVMESLALNFPHSVWARQLNIESHNGAASTKIVNNGATLWILGLKTEGKGTVIHTSGGGKTELLGTLIYPVEEFTAAEKQQAAFINNDSSQSLIYALSSYGPNRNYDIQVEETRSGVTRRLLTQEIPGRMPLFVGYSR